jgi:NAD(P)-dependent dehydrogenase (short-subunit alcohol dehydrogenase family)
MGSGTTKSRHSNKGENVMDLGLQDKHAIVTGGSRGIGKAIARELAREGADVAIVARNKADLEATARELAAETNRRIVPLAADVTSKEQVDRMVTEAAQQLGGLHILVNSGSAPGGSATATGPIETVIDEDLLQDFNVKYVGALRCSRAVIPFMKTAGWGRIINISGGNARNAGNLSGGARNAGLVHMTKTLAVQLGRHGITVNCIHPGTTRTERTPSLLAARAAQLGVSSEEAERQDFAPDSPRGNAICRMVDASEARSLRSSWARKRPGRSPGAGRGKRWGRTVGILLSRPSRPTVGSDDKRAIGRSARRFRILTRRRTWRPNGASKRRI